MFQVGGIIYSTRIRVSLPIFKKLLKTRLFREHLVPFILFATLILPIDLHNCFYFLFSLLFALNCAAVLCFKSILVFYSSYFAFCTALWFTFLKWFTKEAERVSLIIHFPLQVAFEKKKVNK